MPSVILDEAPSSFEGHLLINTRTITRTGQTIGEIASRRRGADGTITVSELAELVVLLESITTSASLFYDGTVPPVELEKTIAQESALEDGIGEGNLFSPLSTESMVETASFCRRAAVQATPLLRKRIVAASRDPVAVISCFSGVRPINLDDPGNHGASKQLEAFRTALVRPLPSENEAAGEAAELAGLDLMGAKCVAGLRMLEPADEFDVDFAGIDRVPLRTLAQDFVRGQSTRELAYSVPMLINTFRANYMNELGQQRGRAALFAGPDVGGTQEQQVMLLASHAAARLCADALSRDAGASAIGRTLVKQDGAFPFLGLLTLLSADDGDPYGPFRMALADRDALRAGYLAKLGPQVRYWHDMNGSDLADFKAAKLDIVYRRLTRRAKAAQVVNVMGGLLDRANQRLLVPLAEVMAEGSRYFKDMATLLSGHGLKIDTTLLTAANEAKRLLPQWVEHVGNRAQIALTPGAAVLGYQTYAHRIASRLKTLRKDAGNDSVALLDDRIQAVLGVRLVEE